jgi:hypothetical protein
MGACINSEQKSSKMIRVINFYEGRSRAAEKYKV